MHPADEASKDVLNEIDPLSQDQPSEMVSLAITKMSDRWKEYETSRKRTDEIYTKLVTKVKRGTGTRDQDTVKVTTRHPDPQEAAINHQKSIETVRSLANSARTIQPDEPEEDNADQ